MTSPNPKTLHYFRKKYLLHFLGMMKNKLYQQFSVGEKILMPKA